MNMIMLNIQNSGRSVPARAVNDNSVIEAPAMEIVSMRIFLYELMYTIINPARHTIPQARINIGDAYPILREKRLSESIIKMIDASLLITMAALVDDPFMNWLSTPQRDRLYLCALPVTFFYCAQCWILMRFSRYYILVVIFSLNINLTAFVA